MTCVHACCAPRQAQEANPRAVPPKGTARKANGLLTGQAGSGRSPSWDPAVERGGGWVRQAEERGRGGRPGQVPPAGAAQAACQGTKRLSSTRAARASGKPPSNQLWMQPTSCSSMAPSGLPVRHLSGQACTHRSQPVQSWGDTCVTSGGGSRREGEAWTGSRLHAPTI